ncbi:MAG: hypothetical protein ACI4BC_08320 [Muribaculaceae bacterium]
MKRIVKWSVAIVALTLIGYFVIFTIVDARLMGLATPSFDFSVDAEEYVIPKATRIDSQTGYKCSAFSSAYLIRHQGREMYGDNVYDVMTDKMEGGYVYPKGIVKFLEFMDLSVEYHIGNLAALKNEVAKGDPVIVMIKIRPDRDWLHYVPVVGYTPDSVFIAESLPELCNAVSPLYNRSISTADFLELWNTSAFKMPLYRNTFISAHK